MHIDAVGSDLLQYIFSFVLNEFDLALVDKQWNKCFSHKFNKNKYKDITMDMIQKRNSNICIIESGRSQLNQYEIIQLGAKSIMNILDINIMQHNDVIILNDDNYQINNASTIKNKTLQIIGSKEVKLNIESINVINSDILIQNIYFIGEHDDNEAIITVNNSRLKVIQCTFRVIHTLSAIWTFCKSVLVVMKSKFWQELNGINVDSTTKQVQIIESEFIQLLGLLPRLGCIHIMNEQDDDSIIVNDSLHIELIDNTFDHNESWIIACSVSNFKLNVTGNTLKGVNEPLNIAKISTDLYFSTQDMKELVVVNDVDAYWQQYNEW